MKTQFIINPKMKETLKEYKNRTGYSMTTTIHLALELYFNNLAMNDKLRQTFMKSNNEKKNITRKTT